jgi:hypothetical protein
VISHRATNGIPNNHPVDRPKENRAVVCEFSGGGCPWDGFQKGRDPTFFELLQEILRSAWLTLAGLPTASRPEIQPCQKRQSFPMDINARSLPFIANGNLSGGLLNTENGTLKTVAFISDAQNRLVSATVNGTVATFTHDPRNRVVQRSTDGTTPTASIRQCPDGSFKRRWNECFIFGQCARRWEGGRFCFPAAAGFC